MAHIVCITTGLTGILYASLELAKRLEAEGHQVTYACPAEVGEKVRANGIRYQQLSPVNYFPAPKLPDFRGKLWKLKRWWYRLTHAKKIQQAALENLGIDAFETKLKEWSADLFLIDVELHEHLMTAVAKKQNVLLLSQWFYLNKAANLPPLVSDTIPQKGRRGTRLGIAWAWQRIRMKRWWIFYKKRVRSVGTNRRSILKKYAQQAGFPLQWAKENYWPGPFTYNTLPILSMTLGEMEFPYAKPSNFHYVGAMVLADRKDLDTNERLEQQLEFIFKEKRKKNAALIYCSVSTFKAGDQAFLRRLVEAVSERPDYLLIIGLGGLLEEDFLPCLPPNVHTFSWIPQLKILRTADCSINHGGIHTINECIHFQVPMLVYSGKRSDQDGCAARVDYHGLGIMADKDRDTPLQIRQKIKRVLEDPSYKVKLAQMKEYYQQYKESKCLENVIETKIVNP